jgi:predicted esterase
MKSLIGAGLILLGVLTAGTEAATAGLIDTYPPAVTVPTVTVPTVTVPTVTAPAATPVVTPVVTPAPQPNVPSTRAACDLPGLTSVEESNGTTIVLPTNYDKRKQYPAIVILPYTDSNACRFFNWVFRDRYTQNSTPYIAILPAAIASRADYATGELFDETVGRFESTINDDIKTLTPKYNIDRKRISLAGFSFGADLGWALTVRNPGVYNGALIIDSFCNYRDTSKMNALAQGNTRFFLIAGEKDDAELDHPMKSVENLLDEYRIANVYETFAEASHSEIINEIPIAMYQQALNYILAEGDSVPVTPRNRR